MLVLSQGHGSFHWHHMLPALRAKLWEHHSSPVMQFQSADNRLLKIEAPIHNIYFSCTHGHQRQATTTLFSPTALSKRVWCPQCKRTYLTTHWNCSCGQPWHLCSSHGSIAMVTTSPKQASPSSSTPAPSSPTSSEASRKRLAGPYMATRVPYRPRIRAKFPKLCHAS